jgi:4-diphosphocytidyl-2C-methyl-D-erythritol kinase
MNSPQADARITGFAKINLGLAVSPPEPISSAKPGWHKVCTWMLGLELGDDIEVWKRVPNGSGTNESDYAVVWADDASAKSAIDWPIESDLAARAHRALEERVGKPLPIAMRVTKRVPVGGGLGGGSADAAAALIAVNHAWKLGFGESELIGIARKLGSDVPFLLRLAMAKMSHAPDRLVSFPIDRVGTGAIASGFGEVLAEASIQLAQLPWVVLILPDFSCATAQVYREFDQPRVQDMFTQSFDQRALEISSEARASLQGDAGQWCECMGKFFEHRNDLWHAVARMQWNDPHNALSFLSSLRACANVPVMMSGSGSTFFCLFAQREDAQICAHRVGQLNKQIDTGTLQTLGLTSVRALVTRLA